jgi:steroid 5-alpha reductase family enzyme
MDQKLMLSELLHIALLIFAYANIWFVISLILRRNDVADIAWGLGYLLIAGYFIATRPLPETAWWVYVATALWALRLAGHIFLRTIGKKEDFRYRQWRQDWGRSFYVRSWLQVYMLQAAILLVVAAPLFVAGWAPEGETGFWTGFGAGAFIAGFILETVADYQLARFLKTRKNCRRNPANRRMGKHPAPQLHRRNPRLVGHVFYGRGTAVWLGGRHQSCCYHVAVGPRFGGAYAGKAL